MHMCCIVPGYERKTLDDDDDDDYSEEVSFNMTFVYNAWKYNTHIVSDFFFYLFDIQEMRNMSIIKKKICLM